MAATVLAPAAGLRQGPPPPGQGGPGGPGGPRRGGFDDKILESLHLTASQKAKVKALKDKQRTQMMKMFGQRPPQGGPGGRGPGGPDREKFRAAMEKGRAKYLAGLKKILTKQQFAKYEVAAKKARAEREAHRPRD